MQLLFLLNIRLNVVIFTGHDITQVILEDQVPTFLIRCGMTREEL